MNLQEFVKDVLIQIDKAVDEARDVTSRDIHFLYGGDKETVKFDIAVSVDDRTGVNGKAGIRVLKFAEAGGDISKETSNSTVSRITFGVKINSETKAEREALKVQRANDPRRHSIN
jgi:hypothetical protein